MFVATVTRASEFHYPIDLYVVLKAIVSDRGDQALFRNSPLDGFQTQEGS